MVTVTGSAFERAAFPEQVGVSSAKLQAYIDDVLANGIELHSLMVLRHGKVAAELWRKPYAAEYPHVMYSVSKTITSLAIGFAVDEGYLNINSKVIDFFPEFKPKKPDPRLEKMTVYHLLTMTAGKDPFVFENKTKIDWLKQFFKARWSFSPGESWKYISENQYVLLELLRRATGKTATEFLTPRLYEPLGFGRVPVWETARTGTESGGWGLFLKTEEMAKIAQCIMNGGRWNEKQLIPAQWATKMQSKLVDNTPTNERWPDQCNGYGLCMWRNPLPNSSRLDGMFGQFALLLNDYDAIVVTTFNEIDEMSTREFFWKHVPGFFCEEAELKPIESVDLSIPELSPPVAKPRVSSTEKNISGKTYKIRKAIVNNLTGTPMSVATMPILLMSAYKRGNINNLSFDFKEDSCVFKWTEDSIDGKIVNSVVCGMDGNARTSYATIAKVTYTMNCWAVWTDSNTLEMHFRPLESLNDRTLTFTFNGKKIKMRPDMTGGVKNTLNKLLDIYMEPFIPMSKLTVPIAKLLSPLLSVFFEPTLSGKEISSK